MAGVLFSMEVPISLLEEMEPHIDYHFCIASYVAKYPLYADYYQNAARLYREGKSTKYVMLDNGAHEAHSTKGTEYKYMTPDDLFDVSKFIQPQVAFAPDIVHQGDATYQLTLEYLSKWKDDRPWQVGVIPQGRTSEEIAKFARLMYEDLANLGKPQAWLGLSFHNDRDAVMRLLGRSLGYFRVHMLGLSELEEIQWWPRIALSVDTSKPIKAAILGVDVAKLPRGIGLMTPESEIPEQNRVWLQRNIAKVRAYCYE